MATESEIVLTLVDDNSASNDAVGSNKLELGIGGIQGGLAISTDGDVAEITGVADLGGGGTVGQAVGVEVSTSRHASVGVVTKLVDVETVLAGGQTSQLGLDVDGGGLVLLGEVDGSGDVLLVGAENANSLDGHDGVNVVLGEVGVWMGSVIGDQGRRDRRMPLRTFLY